MAVLILLTANLMEATSADDKNRLNESNSYAINNITVLNKIGDGFTACSWTKDDNILLTKKGFTGLYLYDQTKQTKKTISDEMSVGYKYQQIDEGNQLITKYAIFSNKASKRKEGVKVFNLNSLKIKAEQLFDESRIHIPTVSIQKANTIKVGVNNKMEDITVQSLANTAGKITESGFWDKYPLVYTDEGLRLYKDDDVIEISDMYGIDAVISPNGKLMCYNDRGILKMRDEQQNERTIGEGLNASWLPGSAAIIYQITKDDGQEIIGSDIYIYDLNLNKTFQLTNTADVFEEYPSVSKDGKQLLFTEINTGILYISDLVTQ